MQITFDPRDGDACASVLAMIAALHDPSVMNNARKVVTPEAPFNAATVFGGAVGETVNPQTDEQPDPAAAFGGGNGAANAGTPPEPAQAGTPGAGTTTESSNGPAATNTASPSSAVDLDADGLPWDARIHSGPEKDKPKNADGRWRRKRGVDDATVETVTAELRRVMGAPAPAPTPAAAPTPPVSAPPPPPVAAAPTPPVSAPPPPPVAAVPAPPAPVAEAPTAANVPPPPTPAAADTGHGQAVAATAPSDAPAKTFAELMKKITARQTAGTLTVGDTKAAAELLGLTGVADLLKRPDLLEAFEQALPAVPA